jgi:thioredoxin-like negative regulator of GroEL
MSENPTLDPAKVTARPRLVFFGSRTCGRCRRAEAFLAQILQRSRNHDTFAFSYVDCDDHPEVRERFRVEVLPTLVVVEDRKVRARLVRPQGCVAIQEVLAPWLRGRSVARR